MWDVAKNFKPIATSGCKRFGISYSQVKFFAVPRHKKFEQRTREYSFSNFEITRTHLVLFFFGKESWINSLHFGKKNMFKKIFFPEICKFEYLFSKIYVLLLPRAQASTPLILFASPPVPGLRFIKTREFFRPPACIFNTRCDANRTIFRWPPRK